MTQKVARIEGRIKAVAVLGPDLGRVDIVGEGLGRGVSSGQFAMVEAVGRPDRILLRPYSYFLLPSVDAMSLLVKAVGFGTRGLLQATTGDEVGVLGPLGTAFPPVRGTCWAVAGGVGAAPFGMQAREAGFRVLFGARSEREAGFARALADEGAVVELATDDGSSGFHGSVVDLLAHKLAHERPPDAIYTCGPSAMMQAVAAQARRLGIAAWASLEARMGCGIGICRGCAHSDASGAWRCICVDGPVYPCEEIFSPEECLDG